MTSLNPVMPVGAQVPEGLRRTGFPPEAQERTLEVLGEVGLPHPAATARLIRTSSPAACDNAC